MDLSARVLGAHTANALRERASNALLTIGKDVFDRRALSKVECFNFVAAANLSAILNRELYVVDTKDVFERIKPSELAIPRLGAISLAVLGAAFEAKGLGGDAPLEAWMRRHLDKGQDLVTFGALKHHDHADRAAEKRERLAAKARKTGRRDQAHRLRVDRHLKRQSTGG